MKGKEGWNFFRIEQLSLFNRHYLYFDKDQCSVSLIRRRNVRMKVTGVLRHRKEGYVVVDCKVRKKDAGEFEAAMEELPNKMLICGYRDYPSFCDLMAAQFEEMRKEKERGEAKNAHRNHRADCGGGEGRRFRDGSGTAENPGIGGRTERQL